MCNSAKDFSRFGTSVGNTPRAFYAIIFSQGMLVVNEGFSRSFQVAVRVCRQLLGNQTFLYRDVGIEYVSMC